MVEDGRFGDSWDHGLMVGARALRAFLRIATERIPGSEAQKTIRTEWRCSSVRPEMDYVGAPPPDRPPSEDDLRQVAESSNVR